MLLILLIVLVLFVLGGWPGVGPEGRPLVPHDYGYAPSGIGLVLVIILIVLLLNGGSWGHGIWIR